MRTEKARGSSFATPEQSGAPGSRPPVGHGQLKGSPVQARPREGIAGRRSLNLTRSTPTVRGRRQSRNTALGAGPGPLDLGRNRHSPLPRRGSGSQEQAGTPHRSEEKSPKTGKRAGGDSSPTSPKRAERGEDPERNATRGKKTKGRPQRHQEERAEDGGRAATRRRRAARGNDHFPPAERFRRRTETGSGPPHSTTTAPKPKARLGFFCTPARLPHSQQQPEHFSPLVCRHNHPFVDEKITCRTTGGNLKIAPSPWNSDPDSPGNLDPIGLPDWSRSPRKRNATAPSVSGRPGHDPHKPQEGGRPAGSPARGRYRVASRTRPPETKSPLSPPETKSPLSPPETKSPLSPPETKSLLWFSLLLPRPGDPGLHSHSPNPTRPSTFRKDNVFVF
ncbi:serine/arginine repetitive matrix protein 1-like [Monodelphis domestica]|uniref:serine/arginine repetitive matrix protein 1-like n=1 Tax=Monodelphis domestica TaxID=13616 RepID=UPI0024E1B86F|nr:serine/arginine repetitive matrix protein 1-like [Monodelphis domestica]